MIIVRHPAVSSVLYIRTGGGAPTVVTNESVVGGGGGSDFGSDTGGDTGSDSGSGENEVGETVEEGAGEATSAAGDEGAAGDTAGDMARETKKGGEGADGGDGGDGTSVLSFREELEECGAATCAWRCAPKENRFLLFDGSLLHGVPPAAPTATPPTASTDGATDGGTEEGRVTLMLGWWAEGDGPACSPAPTLLSADDHEGGEIGSAAVSTLVGLGPNMPLPSFPRAPGSASGGDRSASSSSSSSSGTTTTTATTTAKGKRRKVVSRGESGELGESCKLGDSGELGSATGATSSLQWPRWFESMEGGRRDPARNPGDEGGDITTKTHEPQPAELEYCPTVWTPLRGGEGDASEGGGDGFDGFDGNEEGEEFHQQMRRMIISKWYVEHPTDIREEVLRACDQAAAAGSEDIGDEEGSEGGADDDVVFNPAALEGCGEASAPPLPTHTLVDS